MCIQKQMAITLTRWRQLNKHGKTNWRAKKEKKKLIALQVLAAELKFGGLDPLEYLERCSKAMKFHFNSIEADIDVDLEELVQLSVRNNLAVSQAASEVSV